MVLSDVVLDLFPGRPCDFSAPTLGRAQRVAFGIADLFLRCARRQVLAGSTRKVVIEVGEVGATSVRSILSTTFVSSPLPQLCDDIGGLRKVLAMTLCDALVTAAQRESWPLAPIRAACREMRERAYCNTGRWPARAKRSRDGRLLAHIEYDYSSEVTRLWVCITDRKNVEKKRVLLLEKPSQEDDRGYLFGMLYWRSATRVCLDAKRTSERFCVHVGADAYR